MRIVNRKKFNRLVILVIMFILVCISAIFSNSYSKGEIKYKEIYIYSGDTLWSIAQTEIDNNEYFRNRDIRDIIREIKVINNLEEGYIKIGEKLIIPTFEKCHN